MQCYAALHHTLAINAGLCFFVNNVPASHSHRHSSSIVGQSLWTAAGRLHHVVATTGHLSSCQTGCLISTNRSGYHSPWIARHPVIHVRSMAQLKSRWDYPESRVSSQRWNLRGGWMRGDSIARRNYGLHDDTALPVSTGQRSGWRGRTAKQLTWKLEVDLPPSLRIRARLDGEGPTTETLT